MYSSEILPPLQKKLQKLFRKDKSLYEQVLKKIEEIITGDDVEHYKNLKYDFSDMRRVHCGHFVLAFKLIKQENKIIFVDLDHHDNIYLH